MRFVRFGAGLVALALSAHAVAAQQPGAPRSPSRRPGGMMDMSEHMRLMDSLNARLDTLVKRMNAATGNRKVTAVADVINELVAQRKAMHEQMRQMMESRQGMMMHMMGDSAPADTGHAAHHPPE